MSEDAGVGAPTRYRFAVDRRFAPLLALIGVTSARAWVALTDDRLLARFGPWRVTTGLDNVVGVTVTGPYRWWRAIGPRVSAVDRGLTFGTNCDRGVCVRFRHAVPGFEPLGVLRHPGLTVTVDQPLRLAAELERRAGVT